MDGPSFSEIQTLEVAATTATTATVLRQDQTPSSQWPSSEQQRGIAALSALNNSEIFSVLDSLRSIPSHLTDQHVNALVCLRSAPDDYVKRWLEYDRRCSGTVQSERSSILSSFSDSRFSTASCSSNNTSLSDLSSPPSKTVECPRSNGGAQISSTQRHVKVHVDLNKPQPPLPQGPSNSRLTAPESQYSTHRARHERWCTTREHKSVFTTYRGFAKHENEHDNYYVFLPQGPIENTLWGPQCALCEATNPSKAHLLEHNTLQYDGWIGKSITRSRRGNFEELLRKHKTSDEKIKVLLNKWRKDPEKKAYACGFCVRLFRTLPDRTSHIDREHYAKGAHINDWDDTLVIKGLLLQQDLMQECLRLFYPVDPTSVETKISWPPPIIEDLQLRLELRQEMAKDLARDVFKARTVRPSSPRRRHKLSDSCSYTESGKCIETSTLTQQPTKSDGGFATHADQLATQDSGSLQGPHAQRQANYNQNKLGISHIPVLSLPPHQQLSQTNSALPILSVGPVPHSSGNAGFLYNMSNDPFGAEGSTSEVPPDLLASPNAPYVGLSELNSLDDQYSARMSPDSDPLPQSFDASACLTVSHTSSQLHIDPYPNDTAQKSFQSSRPKRKLSDKSAKEANLKAQTQSPISKYNQGYSMAKWCSSS